MSMDQLDQHQLQEVRAELIVEEYRSLRAEIIQRVQARQQMWYVLLFIAGTFFTIGVQPGIAAWTILLYPLITLFFSTNWAHNDTRIDQITWYIQYEIEKPLEFMGWETYRTQKFRRKFWTNKRHHPLALVPGLLAISARGVFLTTQLMALCIGMVRLISSGELSLAILSLLINLIVIIATYSLLSDRKVQATQMDKNNLPKN
jgi:hypothetical protein